MYIRYAILSTANYLENWKCISVLKADGTSLFPPSTSTHTPAVTPTGHPIQFSGGGHTTHPVWYVRSYVVVIGKLQNYFQIADTWPHPMINFCPSRSRSEYAFIIVRRHVPLAALAFQHTVSSLRS